MANLMSRTLYSTLEQLAQKYKDHGGEETLANISDPDKMDEAIMRFAADLERTRKMEERNELLQLVKNKSDLGYIHLMSKFLMSDGRIGEACKMISDNANTRNISTGMMSEITCYIPPWASPALRDCVREFADMFWKELAHNGNARKEPNSDHHVELKTIFNVRLIYVTECRQLYRYTSGNHDSIYFTDTEYPTAEAARDALSVRPEWNAMTHIVSYILHPPAFILSGQARALPGYSGGGNQLIVPLTAPKTQIYMRELPH